MPLEFMAAAAAAVVNRLDGDDLVIDGAEWQVEAIGDLSVQLTDDHGHQVTCEVSVTVTGAGAAE
jgi:hypothetical protein